jgi:transcriptional regulator with XRE-family HTH domain
MSPGELPAGRMVAVTRRAVAIDRATRRMERDIRRALEDIAEGRRIAGLSLRAVEVATGVSKSAIDRLEGYRGTTIDLAAMARIAAATGYDLRLQLYPAGDPIRDAGSQRLLGRFRALLHPSLDWRTEATLAIDGDVRAWDAEIRGRTWRCHVEAETVIVDVQELERRLERKRRDGGGGHLIVVVADTRRNRRALAAAPAAFGGFSRDARAVLRALRRGEDPGCDAILMV